MVSMWKELSTKFTSRLGHRCALRNPFRNNQSYDSALSFSCRSKSEILRSQTFGTLIHIEQSLERDEIILKFAALGDTLSCFVIGNLRINDSLSVDVMLSNDEIL